MWIGELAERSGITPETIRYYEKLGLISPAERVGRGHRHYDETALARLQKIDALKQLGLSLEEIGQVIDLYFEGQNGLKGKLKVLTILEAHRRETDEKIASLQAFRTELEQGIQRMQGLIRGLADE